MKYDIKDIKLAKKGYKRIMWANNNMPVLSEIRKRFNKTKPLKGVKLAACLHVTTETANLMRTLKDGGASVVLCASNPLSTQDDVAASLVKDFDIPTFSIRAENRKVYYEHLKAALDTKPHITMDDGADLFTELVKNRQGQLKDVWGSTEETTTGVIRLKSMEKQGVLPVPVIAVNDSQTKHLFDNRYGTGQSTIDGILRATNLLIAGSTFVICGYGWCGRGVSMRAKGMGAEVVICEVDPVRALEARMDGFRVMPLTKAATIGNVFVTVTGDAKVITKEHFEKMKNGAIIANAGHFDVEIDIKALKKMSNKYYEARKEVMAYEISRKKTVYVLGSGRLINLAAAEGHPAMVMDMSFANQALAAEHIKNNHKQLDDIVYTLPNEIDEFIATLKLKTMGIKTDKLTDEQEKYLSSWKIGT
ncbi:adenosylhomocysteinase [Patescibacteria group bacterium]